MQLKKLSISYYLSAPTIQKMLMTNDGEYMSGAAMWNYCVYIMTCILNKVCSEQPRSEMYSSMYLQPNHFVIT